ncbi:hypothetical protein V8B97DRAFT_2025904 [Scleroderma yunnanense]
MHSVSLILLSKPGIMVVHLSVLSPQLYHTTHLPFLKLYTPELSFDAMDTMSPVDSQGLQEEPSHSYLGDNQSSQHLSFMAYHGGGNNHDHTPFSYASKSSYGQSIGQGHSETPMDNYQMLYSAPHSRSGSYLGDELNYDCRPNIQGLHAVVAQLMANVKHLSEVKAVEQIIGELQERSKQKLTTSRTNLNHHTVLKSIIQLLYFQLCRIKCDGTKANHIAALVAVKPLKNRQPFELSTKGLQIWHPDWLGKVDDVLNAKFIKEVADHVFNNEKSQRENTQLKTIPDKSFNLAMITDCIKIYFQTIHKRTKELHSDQGTCKVKVALQYETESGNQGTVALILMGFRSDILTCEDNKVSEDTLQQRKNAEVGHHAWRSIDYIAFLHWLSLHAMKQQQHTIKEPAVGQEPQHKWCRTTKKQHKQVFDVALKYLNHDKPLTKGVIFKAMVNEGWYDQHPDTVVHEGINWLKGFYSHINQSKLFKVDTMYLKELDT